VNSKALAGLSLTAMFVCGCGGGSTPTVTMALTSAGFNPGSVSVRYGYALKFDNQDSAAHQIGSQSCPDLKTSSIAPGKSATVTPAVGDVNVGSCDVYDTLAPTGSYAGIVHVQGAG
jgi:hypothetical protein